MLKKQSFFVVALLALAFVPIAHAEDSSPSATVQSNTTTGPAMMRESSVSAQKKTLMQSKRDEFKTRLQTIKDTQKQGIVDKVDTRITTINSTQTQQWSATLDRLDMVLTRISSEGAMLKTEGKNTLALEVATKSAQTAIATARTAVKNQSAKDYVITIGSEAALKTSVGSTVSLFRNDLRITRQTVVAAREAVMRASTELHKVKDTGMIKTPTVNATKSAVIAN